MTVRAYLCLGSNLGERVAHLRQAVERLAALPGCSVSAVSAVYESEPVDRTDQPAFLNLVVALDTSLSAEDLLLTALDIESRLGRVRHARFGPRTIDIDVLWYGGETYDTPQLVLPHPRLVEREFALAPLADLAPELVVGEATVREHLRRVRERPQGVRPWGRLPD